MSWLDTVRANVRQVLAAGALTDTWQYQRRTSDAAAGVPTFGTAGTVAALFIAGGTVEQFDDKRSEFKLANVGRLRMADNALSPQLVVGDRVIAPDGEVWAVVSIQSEAPGSIAYGISREQGLRAEPTRGGGV